MNIICSILIVIQLGSIKITTQATAMGKVLKHNKDNYLVDFSRDAKLEEWIGDYSKVLVKIEKCVEMDNE